MKRYSNILVNHKKALGHLTRVEKRSYLIGIKDADNLVGRDGQVIGVDLAQAVVQIARLAVHLALGAGATADIDHIRGHAQAPFPLLFVLAIITQVDRALAAAGQWRIEGRLEPQAAVHVRVLPFQGHASNLARLMQPQQHA